MVLLSEMEKKLFEMQSFCISARKTCMSARHFHQSAGPFIIFLIHFHCVPCRRFLHLGPQFSPVGRSVYYFTISFPLGSRQEVFASRARKTCMSARQFHQSAGPFTILLLFYYFISIGFQAGGFCISGSKTCQAGGFCISGRKTCMSAHHFHRLAGPFVDSLNL